MINLSIAFCQSTQSAFFLDDYTKLEQTEENNMKDMLIIIASDSLIDIRIEHEFSTFIRFVIATMLGHFSEFEPTEKTIV